jgi:MinD-like ATPase involved in chromosome partitioning or flagellar assembly
MMAARVVTVAGAPALEASLAERLGLHASFELMLRCVDRAELLGAIRGGRLDAVVSAGLPPWIDAQVIEEASKRDLKVIAVEDGMVERPRLARLGVRYVATGDVDAILAVIESSDRPPAPPPTTASESRGRLIAVWGPKGAPGRTTIALELASQLAATEPATLLIDGDPYGGDVVQLVGMVEELPTIVWAARMAAKEELDAGTFAAELRRAGARGPVVLPGLPRADLWPEISDFGWRRLLAEARASFAFTVCDSGFCIEPDPSPYPESGEGRNRVARLTLSEADTIVAVCRGDAVGVKQFACAYEGLRAHVDAERVVVVVNRGRAAHARELRELLKKHVGKAPAAIVPERVSDLHRAVDAGKTVHEAKPSSEICDALRPVVGALGGVVEPRGLLTRLGGKR